MCRFANVLKALGVKRGDRVGIYMPMIPELPIAMLACTRIGAAHSFIFGGFSPDSIIDRVNDAEAKVIITADGGFRRGAPARSSRPSTRPSTPTPSVTAVVVVQPHRQRRRRWSTGRDHWYHDLMANASPDCPPEHMDTEDLLFLLYTSGTTAKPKGIMHTTGGYLTQVASATSTSSTCTPTTTSTGARPTSAGSPATATSSTARSPTAATTVMYEGTPDTPGRDRFWAIIERYGVTQLYTAPTAIRTFMKWGDDRAGDARPVEPPRARHRRRAHQPRGLDVVPQPHRRRAAARSSTPGGRPRPAPT